MVSHLRQHFNSNFAQSAYHRLLRRLDDECGTHLQFRVCETPIFMPGHLVREMENAGKEIIIQLMSDPDYLERSAAAIPSEFNVPNESPHPLFIAVDFGITRDENGNHVPRLIELQGFPTLFAYQPTLCNAYRETYELPDDLSTFLGGLNTTAYNELVRVAILGDCDPENVVLMEIDPQSQKTLPDFNLTERLCGIATVNVRDLVKKGDRLFYKRDGTVTPIHRIYNRIIPEEFVGGGPDLPFSFGDYLEVEWAGHPNWFFKLSKFSIPFLKHPTVPRTMFLADAATDLHEYATWVLKPLYSFAGGGVIVGPGAEDIKTIPGSDRRNYILQERVEYAGVIDTPHGLTKAEVRIMYIWIDELVAVNTLVRLGRGQLMGVSHNKNLEWVGSSAGFWIG